MYRTSTERNREIRRIYACCYCRTCLRYRRLAHANRLLLHELYCAAGVGGGILKYDGSETPLLVTAMSFGIDCCVAAHLWRGSKHALYSDWCWRPVTCSFLVRHGCGSKRSLAKNRYQPSGKATIATVDTSRRCHIVSENNTNTQPDLLLVISWQSAF